MMPPPDPTIVVALDGSISSLERVHEGLAELWQRHPRISSFDRMALETAAVELATNAIRYAVPSGGSGAEVRLVVGFTEVIAEITYQGPEFPGYLDHFAMPGPHAESGRGLAVIDALMDVFEYRRTPAMNAWTPAVNHWRIIRRLTTPVGLPVHPPNQADRIPALGATSPNAFR